MMRHPLKTLWYTRCPHPSPLGLASQLGWFLDEFADDGIDVFTLQETQDRRLLESHLDHHLTNSFRQGGSGPAIWARSRGADTRVIGFNWVDEYQAILAMPDSGIHELRDLRGRRCGLPRNDARFDIRHSESLRGFTVCLQTAGLGEENVRFVDIAMSAPASRDRSAQLPRFAGYGALISALQSGEVDVIYVKGSRGLQATREAGARVVFDLRTIDDPLMRANHGAPRPITVDNTLLREHPEIAARFLARVVAVGSWSVAHPAETTFYMSRETRSAECWVREAYGHDLHLRQNTVIDDKCVAALRTYKDFLLQKGLIPKDFSLDEWIDTRPLDAAVTRIRSRIVVGLRRTG
jgi:ABC-type nitrate/sulfonate/bicarbonate transport system substrate-binding protein